MKINRSLVVRLITVFLSILSVFAIPLISSPVVYGNNFPPAPILRVTITTPQNGAVIWVDTDFSLAFTITNSGSVPAIDVSYNINVTGPATLFPGAITTWPNIAPNQTVTSPTYTLHCNGTGTVTITVTPTGIYDLDRIPIPPANLISATVAIEQRERGVPPSSSYNFNEQQFRDPTNANMTTTTVFVQPRQILAGQPVTIYGNMANRGEMTGLYTATLKINGEVEDIMEGTLAGNMAKPLEFTVYRNEPGIYKVDLNGQQTYFEVVSHQQQHIKKISPGVVFIIILSLLLISSLVVLLLYRLNES